MKRNSSSLHARVFIAIPFLLVGIFLLAFSIEGGNRFKSRSRARDRVATRTAPAAPTAPQPTQFSGTYDPHPFPCATARHHFNVPAGQTRLVVQASTALPSNDITVSLLFGPDPLPVLLDTEDTGTSSEALVYAPTGGVPAGEYQVQICQAGNTVTSQPPLEYNGIFTMDDTMIPSLGATPPPFGPIPPATEDPGPKVGFENHAAPGALIPVASSAAGQQPKTVEYMGRGAGEPSIGNNWNTDTTVFYSDLQSLFVKFDNTCPANGIAATWVNRASPTAVLVDSDPIGFTDQITGRSFSGQLTLLSPTCKTSYTDNDGMSWTPTQGSGLASGVDHQTIGGGRYHAPLDLNPPDPVYPHAVYYCSQEGVPAQTGPPAFCSRSDDGGLTFGPSIPLYVPINTCGGLHGHVKVSPKDGTVYVPYNDCNNVGSVVVSQDNGVTWTTRSVFSNGVSAQPSASFQDPAVSIDTTGRVYYVIANNDNAAAVFTSDNFGETWQNMADVSAAYGLQNVRYPAATAGDAGRAAVAFYGTTTPGNALDPNFPGIWHLYIANTFDGGVTWSTVDATPNAPMQRGCIWASGGANICRNLLDFFDMTVDKEGRVLVGYVNGCEGGNCVQAPIVSGQTLPGQGNAYTTTATIARQSSGRRLFFAHDPQTPTSKPGTPSLSARRVANVISLQWSLADTGNLAISNYQVLRGSAPGNETLLNTVTGNQLGGTYTDTLAPNDTNTYYYKVLAVNSAGASCANNEVTVPYPGTTCTGLLIHRNDPTHPEANLGINTPPSHLIDYIAVGEPAGSSNLLFKMKVNSLNGPPPPNSRWRMVWNSFAAQTVANVASAQQFYVGMRTDANSAVTFEYGTLADAGVPAVLVVSETKQGNALPESNYQPDGTISVYIPKAVVGNPQPGALLGGVNGRTFLGDTAETGTLHRSNLFIDHTFVKGQTDNSYPAATYLIAGNNFCTATGVAPIGAVSRKVHGSAGTFDIDLPLSGPNGIECRSGGPSGNHKVLITFPGPVSFSAATCGGQPAAAAGANGSVVTVDCTGLPNAQTTNITLTAVNDGLNTGNVSIAMGVLLGDTTADRAVNSADISQTKSQSGQNVTGSNFRTDLNVDGAVNSADISLVKSASGTALP